MHPQLLIRGAFLAVLGLLLAACQTGESVGEVSLSIVGGEATGNAHGEVVFVSTQDGARIKQCSGTLIAPNLVATALHCISLRDPGLGFVCDSMGNDVSGGTSSLLGPPTDPSLVSVFAGPVPATAPDALVTEIVGSGSDTICDNDIAFLMLDRDLALPTASIHRGAPVALGDALTTVGYGETATGSSLTRNQREVTVTAVGQWLRTFTVSEGPCRGDSGGPSFAANAQLVGVFSTVSLNCTGSDAAGKYTDISFFEPLVERAFAAAGDGSPWPDGGAPDAGSMEPPSDAGAPSRNASTTDASCAFRKPSTDGKTPGALALLAALGAAVRRRARRVLEVCRGG